MNIDRQKVLTTLANPKWETLMYLDLLDIATPKSRLTLHNQAVNTLNSLVQEAHADGRADWENLYRGCLEKLRTGYDL